MEVKLGREGLEGRRGEVRKREGREKCRGEGG